MCCFDKWLQRRRCDLRVLFKLLFRVGSKKTVSCEIKLQFILFETVAQSISGKS